MSPRNEEAPSVGALRASGIVINFEVNHMSNPIVIHAENNSGMSFATLIPVRLGELGGEIVQLCNARDLHVCLGVGRRFATWITERIKEYGFVEGVDFLISRNRETKRGRGGDRRSQEYDLTVDMAKELAMVERTEIGQRIRRYFIQCEKALRKLAPETADDILRRTLNPQQQLELSKKVQAKVALLPQDRRRAGYSELWWHLKSRHQVAQYRDIPQAEFGDACQFVEEFVWEGEWLGKEKESILSDGDWLNLNALVVHMLSIAKCYRDYSLFDHFHKVGSPVGSKLHDHVRDGEVVAKYLQRKHCERMAEEVRKTHEVYQRALAEREMGRMVA